MVCPFLFQFDSDIQLLKEYCFASIEYSEHPENGINIGMNPVIFYEN